VKRGLEKRLATATVKLQALTPPRGRGRRQIQDEALLVEKANAILQEHRVEGLLAYTSSVKWSNRSSMSAGDAARLNARNRR
jgi:transposase